MVKRRRRKRYKGSTLASFKKSAKKRNYSKRYLETRNQVMARDQWTCQMCEKIGLKLQVHHILMWSKSKILRENKSNLISLCSKCHMSIRNKEDLYKTIFKSKVRRNTARYAKEKLTKEEFIEKLKAQQKLPADFTEYVYKTDADIVKEKKEEYYLRKLWRAIKLRTTNKNSTSYRNYGGRGIKMHPEWLEDFHSFQKYILENLGDRPEGASIDRIDNEGHYEPGNVRWQTFEGQGQNRRTTVLDEATVSVMMILYYKYKFKQCEIANKLGINGGTLVRSVVKFLSWKNVSIKYRALVKDEKILKLMDEYENNL